MVITIILDIYKDNQYSDQNVFTIMMNLVFSESVQTVQHIHVGMVSQSLGSLKLTVFWF